MLRTNFANVVIVVAFSVSAVEPMVLHFDDDQATKKINSISTEKPGVISKEMFNLQSPRYPKTFQDKTNIGWTISKADMTVCSMTFVIKDLELATTSCNDAYLLIGDQKFCETKPSERLEIRVANNPVEVVNVRFYSSKRTTLGSKFSIMGIQHSETCVGPIQLKPVTDCSADFNAEDGIFGKSIYLNNTLKYPETNCILTFKRAANYCGVKFDFPSFDFGSDCHLDYVIFNGKKFCGQQLLHENLVVPYPKDILKELTMTVNIGSKNFQGEGFFASYMRVKNDCPVDCNEEYSNSSFILRSPGEDRNRNKANCEYTILKESSQIKCLKIDVRSIDLDSSGKLCIDYLQLFNRKKICKISQLPSKSYKVAFPIRTSFLKASFHADQSVKSTGFEISVQQLSENCPADVCQEIENADILKSPDYPRKFPKNIQCKYVVPRELDAPMKLQMFKIDYDLNTAARLTLPDGSNLKDIFLKKNSYELSLYNDIEIPFRSLSSSGPGFQIFIHKEPEEFKLCNQNDDNSKKQGSFTTPDLAYLKYQVNLNCMMVITKYSEDICKIKLSIHKFELAPPNNVTGECKDYIDWSRNGKKCGNITEKEFGSVEIPFAQGQRKIFIKFFSDAIKDDNGKGANFVYEQSSLNC